MAPAYVSVLSAMGFCSLCYLQWGFAPQNLAEHNQKWVRIEPQNHVSVPSKQQRHPCRPPLTCGLLVPNPRLGVEGTDIECGPMGELMTEKGGPMPLMGELRVLMGECSWPGEPSEEPMPGPMDGCRDGVAMGPRLVGEFRDVELTWFEKSGREKKKDKRVESHLVWQPDLQRLLFNTPNLLMHSPPSAPLPKSPFVLGPFGVGPKNHQCRQFSNSRAVNCPPPSFTPCTQQHCSPKGAGPQGIELWDAGPGDAGQGPTLQTPQFRFKGDAKAKVQRARPCMRSRVGGLCKLSCAEGTLIAAGSTGGGGGLHPPCSEQLGCPKGVREGCLKIASNSPERRHGAIPGTFPPHPVTLLAKQS